MLVLWTYDACEYVSGGLFSGSRWEYSDDIPWERSIDVLLDDSSLHMKVKGVSVSLIFSPTIFYFPSRSPCDQLDPRQ